MFIQILINSAKFLQLVKHGQQILWFKLGQIKDAKKRKWSYRGFPFPQFLKKQVDFEPIKLHLQKFWVRSLKTSLFLFRMASAKQFITITTAALLILMRRPNPWISISSISTWVKRSRSRSRPVWYWKIIPRIVGVWIVQNDLLYSRMLKNSLLQSVPIDGYYLPISWVHWMENPKPGVPNIAIATTWQAGSPF